jgi:GGDEF domain-containing protein
MELKDLDQSDSFDAKLRQFAPELSRQSTAPAPGFDDALKNFMAPAEPDDGMSGMLDKTLLPEKRSKSFGDYVDMIPSFGDVAEAVDDIGRSLGKQYQRIVPGLAQMGWDAAATGLGALESINKGLADLTGLSKGNVFESGERFALEQSREIQKALNNPDLQLPKSKQGALIENPGLVLDPEWLSYNLGETARSMVPIIVAAAGGAPGFGAAMGGGMEGSSLYTQLRNDGVDEGRAATSALSFAVVSGILNKIGLDKMIHKFPKGSAAAKIFHRIVAGGTEAGTEYAEEPFQAAFESLAKGQTIGETRDNVVQSLKHIDVIPASFILGGSAGSVVQTDTQAKGTMAKGPFPGPEIPHKFRPKWDSIKEKIKRGSTVSRSEINEIGQITDVPKEAKLSQKTRTDFVRQNQNKIEEEIANAETVRSDTGQPAETGPVGERGQDQGGENIRVEGKIEGGEKPTGEVVAPRIAENVPSILDRFESEQQERLKQRKEGDRRVSVANIHPVTGMIEGKYANRRLAEMGMEVATENNVPVVYVEGDLYNLGGLNKQFGNSGADIHLKAMANIAREEFDKLGVEVGYTTKGGDEFGFTVVNATQEQVDAVLAKINPLIEQYVEANGLEDVPHTKTERNPGTGITFAAKQFDPSQHANVDDWISSADRALEISKETGGSINEQGKPIETTGGIAPQGQAERTSERVEAPGIGEQEKSGVQKKGKSITAKGFEEDTAALPSEGGMSVVYRGDVAHSTSMNVGEMRRLLDESGGPIPGIFKKLRGAAVGRFSHVEGQPEKSRIKLQADIFVGPVITTGLAKTADVESITNELKAKAIEQYPNLTEKDIEVRVEADKKRPGKQRITLYRIQPDYAGQVLAHEIGHWADYVPDNTMFRGNILGRLASLQKFMRGEMEGLNRKEITEELKALTEWWNPFDPVADDAYTKYRHSSRELYAEAMSVLLNDPAALSQRAPNFYNAWFQYLERKPEVKTAYNQIVQEVVSGVSGNKLLEDIYSGFDRGEDELRRVEEANKKSVEFGTEMGSALIDKFWKINRLFAASKKRGLKTVDPRQAIDAAKYTECQLEGYELENNQILKTLEKSGATEQDMGAYLLIQRGLQAEGEGGKKAIPVVGDKAGAEKALKAFKESLGEKKMAALETARKQWRKVREDWILNSIRDTEVFDKDFTDFLMRNEWYARYEVVDYLDKRHGEGTGLAMIGRVGTLKSVTNPFSATMASDASLMRAVNWNHAKEKIVEFLSESGSAQEAKTEWDGRRQSPVKPNDPSLGLLTYMKDGKLQGFYVDHYVARSFENQAAWVRGVASALRLLAQPARFWYTTARPGFQLFNTFVRDPLRSIVNVKGLTPWGMYYRLGKSIRIGIGESLGKIDPTTQEMRRRGIIVTYGHMADVDESTIRVERFLARHEASGTMKSKILIPLNLWYSKMMIIGSIGETANKRAVYTFMKDNQSRFGWTDEFIDHTIRYWAGSPSFITGGTASPITNNILLFSNAAIQGWRSDIEAFKEDPTGVGLRRLAYNIMPKAVVIAFATGAMAHLFRALGGDDDDKAVKFSEEMKRILAGASEYDLANYIVIPLGLTESGKSVYFRLPQDETGRIMGGLATKLFTGRDFISSLQDASQYTGDQGPGWNPALTFSSEVLQYISGGNPYDSFREKQAVPERIQEAGGSASHKAFSKWLWNRYGGSFIYRFRYDNPEEVQTELEKVIDLPFVGDTMGRFIRVSDYGLVQKLQKASKEARVERTRSSMNLEEIIRKQIKGEDLSDEETQMLQNNRNQAERKKEMFKTRAGGALNSAMERAGSKEEEAAVLREFISLEGETSAVMKSVNEFAGRQLYAASQPRPDDKKQWAQWRSETKRSWDLLNGLPVENNIEAFRSYWRSRGYKVGSDAYNKRVEIIKKGL